MPASGLISGSGSFIQDCQLAGSENWDIQLLLIASGSGLFMIGPVYNVGFCRRICMWIVAVAWIYVVGLMAITEPTVVAGIMTFLFYCVLPLSILYYLSGSKGRRLRNEAAARQRAADNVNEDQAP
jgi:hypothetical protein